MYTPPSSSKTDSFSALRRIKDDALAEDLDKFNIDQGWLDVDIMIEQFLLLLVSSGCLNWLLVSLVTRSDTT